jgi:hypothetical protein
MLVGCFTASAEAHVRIAVLSELKRPGGVEPFGTIESCTPRQQLLKVERARQAIAAAYMNCAACNAVSGDGQSMAARADDNALCTIESPSHAPTPHRC